MIEIMLLASLFGSHTGIIVPDSCNSCPTYDEINQIFPDNIDPKLRDMEHGWKFYLMKPGNEQYIWVNPPIHVHDKIKTITFVPELKPFDGSQYSLSIQDGTVQVVKRWALILAINSGVWATGLQDLAILCGLCTMLVIQHIPIWIQTWTSMYIHLRTI